MEMPVRVGILLNISNLAQHHFEGYSLNVAVGVRKLQAFASLVRLAGSAAPFGGCHANNTGELGRVPRLSSRLRCPRRGASSSMGRPSTAARLRGRSPRGP